MSHQPELYSHHSTIKTPNANDVVEAAARIQGLVYETPILASDGLNKRLGCQMFFKSEHLQKTGAFKFRGANNAIQQLPADTVGTVTHSSGNHGAALAAAASQMGVKAHVVMPHNAVRSKIAAVKSYGGIIHLCEPTQAAREAGMQTLADQGMIAIPPFDHNHIIAGQGTAVLELMRQQPDLDVIVTPVGGGGLYAGSLLAASTKPGLLVYGAEPEQANDTFRSLQAGQRVDDHEANTIADGLRTLVGVRNFAIIQQLSPGIIPVSEEAIIAAMKLLWQRLKQVIEPSAATVLAAVASQPQLFSGKKVGLVLSGGNVDLDQLPF